MATHNSLRFQVNAYTNDCEAIQRLLGKESDIDVSIIMGWKDQSSAVNSTILRHWKAMSLRYRQLNSRVQALRRNLDARHKEIESLLAHDPVLVFQNPDILDQMSNHLFHLSPDSWTQEQCNQSVEGITTAKRMKAGLRQLHSWSLDLGLRIDNILDEWISAGVLVYHRFVPKDDRSHKPFPENASLLTVGKALNVRYQENLPRIFGYYDSMMQGYAPNAEIIQETRYFVETAETILNLYGEAMGSILESIFILQDPNWEEHEKAVNVICGLLGTQAIVATEEDKGKLIAWAENQLYRPMDELRVSLQQNHRLMCAILAALWEGRER